jgi:hypothetical protein
VYEDIVNGFILVDIVFIYMYSLNMVKYKKLLFALLSILLGFIYIKNLCAKNDQIIIEMDNIVTLIITEIYEKEMDYIIISGYFNTVGDNYNYKNIEIMCNNHTVNILMFAELKVLNSDGNTSFNTTIQITKDIDKIVFGNNEIIIWERRFIESL